MIINIAVHKQWVLARTSYMIIATFLADVPNIRFCCEVDSNACKLLSGMNKFLPYETSAQNTSMPYVTYTCGNCIDV
jgi:hypothetical protein